MTADVVVVGNLDAITVHKKHVFFLYPKLDGAGRIECRFAAEILEQVVNLIQHTVEVSGTGHYGPVGLYPIRLDVSSTPKLLLSDDSTLRSFVGTMNLVPAGMSASQYLARNREAAGLGS